MAVSGPLNAVLCMAASAEMRAAESCLAGFVRYESLGGAYRGADYNPALARKSVRIRKV